MQALSSDILAYDDQSSKDERVAVIGHDGIYISQLVHLRKLCLCFTGGLGRIRSNEDAVKKGTEQLTCNQTNPNVPESVR